MTSLLLVLFATPLLGVASIVSSGTVTIPGTFSFDLDAGVVDVFGVDPAADIFWEQFTTTTRGIEPVDGAAIVNLGEVDFASLTLSQLEALTYGSTGIDGSDGTNVLVPGDVFAVDTNSGNFAKVLVTGDFDPSLNNGLPIQWETDSPSAPEPGGFVPALLALIGLGGLKWRRRPC
jgi:hypothetical protein